MAGKKNTGRKPPLTRQQRQRLATARRTQPKAARAATIVWRRVAAPPPGRTRSKPVLRTAQRRGISQSTVDRARQQMTSVTTRRVSDKGGKRGAGHWEIRRTGS